MEEKTKEQHLKVIAAQTTKELELLFLDKGLRREDVITIIKDGEYFRLFYVR